MISVPMHLPSLLVGGVLGILATLFVGMLLVITKDNKQ